MLEKSKQIKGDEKKPILPGLPHPTPLMDLLQGASLGHVSHNAKDNSLGH